MCLLFCCGVFPFLTVRRGKRGEKLTFSMFHTSSSFFTCYMEILLEKEWEDSEQTKLLYLIWYKMIFLSVIDLRTTKLTLWCCLVGQATSNAGGSHRVGWALSNWSTIYLHSNVKAQDNLSMKVGLPSLILGEATSGLLPHLEISHETNSYLPRFLSLQKWSYNQATCFSNGFWYQLILYWFSKIVDLIVLFYLEQLVTWSCFFLC